MDFKDLHIFKTLAEEGNVTKAAELLNYVQSNVTGRIKKLESELQTELFYRSPRGVSLTSEGKLLLKYAEKILHLMEETKRVILNNETPRGPLSIGTNETIASTLLPSVLVSYSQKYPKVELSLKIGETNDLMSDVLDYKLDGAFVVHTINHPDLIHIPITEEELVLISNNKEALGNSLTNLNKQILLTRPNCIYKERLEQWLRDENVFHTKSMEFGTLDAIIRCVKEGLGFSIVTKSLADDYNQLCYHRIPRKYSIVKTVFIRRKDTIINSAYGYFLNMVTENNT